MENVVKLLALMLVSGVITFFVSIYILMDLGARYHGSYEYYGRQYGILTWVPVLIGFLAPALIAGLFWLLKKRRNKRGFQNTNLYD